MSRITREVADRLRLVVLPAFDTPGTEAVRRDEPFERLMIVCLQYGLGEGLAPVQLEGYDTRQIPEANLEECERVLAAVGLTDTWPESWRKPVQWAAQRAVQLFA